MLDKNMDCFNCVIMNCKFFFNVVVFEIEICLWLFKFYLLRYLSYCY